MKGSFPYAFLHPSILINDGNNVEQRRRNIRLRRRPRRPLHSYAASGPPEAQEAGHEEQARLYPKSRRQTSQVVAGAAPPPRRLPSDLRGLQNRRRGDAESDAGQGVGSRRYSEY